MISCVRQYKTAVSCLINTSASIKNLLLILRFVRFLFITKCFYGIQVSRLLAGYTPKIKPSITDIVNEIIIVGMSTAGGILLTPTERYRQSLLLLSDYSREPCHNNGFHKKLQYNVFLLRSKGFTYTYLPYSLSDRYKEYVYYAYPANNQSNNSYYKQS